MIIRQGDKQEYFFEENCFITEVFNREDYPEISVARARVLPGEWTHWHQLESLELYFIVSGKGSVSVGEGVKNEKVSAGDVVVIPAKIPQRIQNVGDEDLVFLAICCPGFKPENYLDLEK